MIGNQYFRITLIALVTLAVALGLTPLAKAEDITVFAAASLKNALDDAAASFQARNGDKVIVSYAASSALAKQIENGAPADLFISADLDWMNYLQQKGLLQLTTRFNLLGNELVLIAPSDSTVQTEIKPGFPLAALLQDGRLAIADPNSVPAGKYGKAALQILDVWPTIENKIAPAEDVRGALLFVARKEAPLGIVYRTDAMADKDVKIVAVFPADSHPPIIYPAALTASSKNPAAAQFLAFLKSADATPYFEKQGFAFLPKP
jgi:molybdate transport system substrate-binding protein